MKKGRKERKQKDSEPLRDRWGKRRDDTPFEENVEKGEIALGRFSCVSQGGEVN